MTSSVDRSRASRGRTPGERGACGTGFVADRHGRRSHELVVSTLEALAHLEHRGAVSPDGRTSDGAGVMTQLPTDLLADEYDQLEAERLAVGMCFMPQSAEARERCRETVEEHLRGVDLETVAWRRVPFDASVLGEALPDPAPVVRQVLIHRPRELGEVDYARRLYLARRRAEGALEGEDFSIPSMSHRTVVYKGLVVPELLPELYPDLADERYRTAIGVFHQRYSTNTTPTWARAQPLRFIAHNGEINTLLGNVNAMRAREPVLESDVWGEDLEDLTPVIDPDGSDSMALDGVLELLIRSGRDPVHAMEMLLPEALEARPDAEPEWRAFRRYHAALMEPWDGPAAIVFSDGRLAGAKLDRNGLRPLRYWITDDRVIAGSETGLIEVAEESIRAKRRLGPGESFVVDTDDGSVREYDQIRERLADRRPWGRWIDEHAATTRSVEAAEAPSLEGDRLQRVQRIFGFAREHLTRLLEPMVFDGDEAVGSMGDDTPLAALSERPQRFCRYFRQRFAQVTNPPIDSLRERSVMSLRTRLALGGTLLEETEDAARFVEFDSPVVTSGELAWLEWSAGCIPSPPLQGNADEIPPVYRRLEGRVARLDTRFPVDAGPEGLGRAVEELCEAAEEAVENGARVLILSDREVDGERTAIPSILAVGAVHHHLIRRRLRLRTGIVCDAGDVLGEHDYAALLGYGAMAIHPRIAYESVAALADGTRDREALPVEAAQRRYRRTVEKGILKIMAKLGISDVASYRGAQTFEILGLDDAVVDQHFEGTPSRVGGATLEDVGRDLLEFHRDAHGDDRLAEAGLYRYRRDGEYHAFNPGVFKKLHAAVREEDFSAFREYTEAVDERPPCTLRDLLRRERGREAVPVDEVEPAESIVRRFSTQAMSFGSLSREMHETLAVAMNRLGAKSNSGEGGEEHERFERYERDRPDRSVADWHPEAGDSGSSAIKQIASGRFGVTPRYLASAEQFEIKMAQGSKPGEGGQLPGHKVTEAIAETRNATPGVALISPPPHHDIYSIEDLAQLIYDLKRVNDRASVAVKLVSLVGVGTIASGVAKAYADTVQISGHDGGTGASPLGSIKHAGLPWELGLADAHRTLSEDGLRDRVRLRVDGGLKTGRDVAIAAMLGADEFGFGTAPLVAAGCVMARQCHLDTCPVGVATQDPELRERFPGTPDRVIAFMCFVAEHLRHIVADLGFRSVEQLVGRSDLLEVRSDLPERAARLELDEVLRPAESADGTGGREERTARPSPPAVQSDRSERPEDPPLDARIAEAVGDPGALEGSVDLTVDIDNRQRAVGARLAGRLGGRQLDLDPATIRVQFHGRAGQSFGAFCAAGMRLVLHGEAQDYVGKGMGGGAIVVRPPEESDLDSHEHVVAGNTCLYGATGGVLYAAGIVGERFAIRNSGATAVVEGCGDHGCEYMTGGTVVVLGSTGVNFGAGMSGGRAYVYDPAGRLRRRLNDSRVGTDRPDAGRLGDLRALIEDFAAQTGSARARELLQNWSSARRQFRCVRPAGASTSERQSAEG